MIHSSMRLALHAQVGLLVVPGTAMSDGTPSTAGSFDGAGFSAGQYGDSERGGLCLTWSQKRCLRCTTTRLS